MLRMIGLAIGLLAATVSGSAMAQQSRDCPLGIDDYGSCRGGSLDQLSKEDRRRLIQQEPRRGDQRYDRDADDDRYGRSRRREEPRYLPPARARDIVCHCSGRGTLVVRPRTTCEQLFRPAGGICSPAHVNNFGVRICLDHGCNIAR